MYDGSPGLEVGFAIDAGGSFETIARLESAMDTAETRIGGDAAKIERATGGMINLGGAAAQISSFSASATRELMSVAREKGRVERAGEGMVRSLERENAAFGKSREELRSMRAEAAAVAAEKQGLTDLAARIRAQEQTLYDQQFAASRRAAQAAAAEAEAKADAAVRAAAAKEAEATAVREAAFAYQMFEARARQGAQAMRDAAAAETAAAAARADLADRGRRLIESVNPAAAAQNRFNAEMAEARTLISAGAISLDDYVAKLTLERAALQQNTAALGQHRASSGQVQAGTQQLAYNFNDFFTQVSMGSGVVQAFTAQLGQTIQAVQLMTNANKGFIGFLAGPYGAVVTGGIMLLGMMATKLLDNEDAVKAAEAAMKKFQDRQADIGNFIDSTTGKLVEQNRTLVLNAILTRQAQIAANDAASTEGRIAAFKAAGNQQTRNPTYAPSSIGAPIRIRETDPDVQAAIKAAGGNVDKLSESIAQLARTRRPDLRSLALDISTQAGAAVLAARENERLGKELRALSGDTKALATGTTSLISKQVALATATTPLEKARARLALVEQGAAAADKAQGAALVTYRRDLTAATVAVKQAEAAEKAASESRRADVKAHNAELREQKKAAREAKAAARELESTFTSLQGRLDPDGASARSTKEALEDIDRLRGAKMLSEEQFISWRSAAYREAADRDAAQIEQDIKRMFPDMPELLGPQTIEFKIEGLEPLFDVADPEMWDLIARNSAEAARGMEDAFGKAGGAVGGLAALYAGYNADRTRLDRDYELRQAQAANDAVELERLKRNYAIATSTRQIGLYGDMAAAAKGFFGENTDGYKAMEVAEKAFRAVEFALSVRAMAQDAIETASSVVKSGVRTAKYAVEAVAKAIASLPFPANIAAGAATVAALAAIGVTIAGAIGGNKNTLPKANDSAGTVLGDAEAKSESIRRAIDALKEVDTLTLSSSRDMAASLRSIDTQIGGFASLVVRAGDIDANAGVQQGFKANAVGSILGNVPLIGGFLKSLFGTSTTVIGSGLYGGAQSIGSILNGGFDASYYSDVEQKKKFLGITTGKSYSTQYSGADAGLENQFTLILRGFNDAIRAAAKPLDVSTSEIEQRLNGFIVDIGKIDTKGLTGAQIEEKLAAVFGGAADGMAAAAIPGIERFQKAGEGAFETLVRVASTVETVTATLDQLGGSARGLSIDAKLGIAGQFDSVRDLSSAADAYFERFYSKAEQNAAKLSRLDTVFVSLGTTMPATIADFRALVDAQDLTTAAGQATYATLLQLAPAFAELKETMEGAKTAADVLAERQDLERKLLELRGDTSALRALDLAKLDASNRALQQQIWAMQDGQEAARAADELRKAWTSVGDSIMDEVERIRGLDSESGPVGFAALMGRFNAMSLSARAGDQDAAKLLPGLSQELLRAAGDAATSRQELDRVRAQTAASLEETFAAISKLAAAGGAQTSTAEAQLAAAQLATTAVSRPIDGETTTDEVQALRDEVIQLRTAVTSGLAAVAGNTGRMAKRLDDVTAQSGGDAISTVAAAA
ncbi:hypothetical protein [uncultured Sphingomonas sp.]|uniref:hypothetical protein n=1 Tax=uncultured Sphingomonas sp. TaxID=158754 RepID=UPI00374804A7